MQNIVRDGTDRRGGEILGLAAKRAPADAVRSIRFLSRRASEPFARAWPEQFRLTSSMILRSYGILEDVERNPEHPVVPCSNLMGCGRTAKARLTSRQYKEQRRHDGTSERTRNSGAGPDRRRCRGHKRPQQDCFCRCSTAQERPMQALKLLSRLYPQTVSPHTSITRWEEAAGS